MSFEIQIFKGIKYYIYRIMHELLWITILSQVKRFANNFHEWRSRSRIALRVAKIFILGNPCIILYPIILYMYVILCPENTPAETIDRFVKDGVFFTFHCNFTTVDLWRHANEKYRYRDIIFVGCSCTCNLAQSLSSVVNGIHEYQYPATRYFYHSL